MTTTLTAAQAETSFATASRRCVRATRAPRLSMVRDHAPAGVMPSWFAIAQACAALGDMAGEEAALAALLAIETRHLPALLLMAQARARAGDDRGATSWYRTALAVPLVPGTTVPAPLHPMLNRALSFLADSVARFADHLQGAATAIGSGREGARIRQSLDLLMGRQEVFLQQPSMFYFPGLPQRAFYEREEFA